MDYPIDDQQLPEEDCVSCDCDTAIEQPTKRARRWPAVLALALIFALGLAAFLLIPPAEPAKDHDAENGNTTPVNTTPWFTIENGVLYFKESLYDGSEELVVPATVNGQTVTALGDECFAYCTDIIMIYLPETIVTIGDEAFYGCNNLRGIRLPETLTSIGDCAFGGCINLEAICIPYSLQEFGEDVFQHCRTLQFFFYPAPYSYWKKLPIGEIPADSTVYCADGVHPAA